METKINKNANATASGSTENKKDRLNKLALILSSASSVVVGAAGASIYKKIAKPHKKEEGAESEDTTEEILTPDQAEAQEATAQQVAENKPATPQPQPEEPKPEEPKAEEPKAEEIEPVDDKTLSEAQAQETDPLDITEHSLFSNIVEVHTYSDLFGNEFPVAVCETPWGDRIAIGDQDGDGIYDTAMTEDGSPAYLILDDEAYIIEPEELKNILADCHITQSDVDSIFDTSGDYLAKNEFDDTLVDDEHEEGEIFDTENPEKEVAQNETTENDEEVTDPSLIGALLSQLIDSDDTTVNSESKEVTENSETDDEDVDIDALLAELTDEEDEDDEDEDDEDKNEDDSEEDDDEDTNEDNLLS